MGNQITVTPLQKLYAVIIMTIFIAPNIFYMVRGGEDFPYTCAPMFAHYIGKGTQLYSFKFIGEFEEHEEILPPRLGKISEMGTMRFFFSKVYGSSDEVSPFGDHVGDTSRHFEERLSRYFKRYLTILSENKQSAYKRITKLRLEVWRYNSEGEVNLKRTVGYYAISSERFIHLWKNH